MAKYEFTPYCDDYDFLLEQGTDCEGDEFYHGIDIPCKDDPVWRFWTLYEYDTDKWSLSDKEKEKIKKQVIRYCLKNGYTFNGQYFEYVSQ